MNLHLIAIGRAVTPRHQAVLVLDGAGWHQAGGRRRVPETVTPLHRPPYSPELKPVEDIWQYLRQNRLGNRVFDGYNAIVGACCEAWLDLIRSPDLITSISTLAWAWLSVRIG